MITHSPADKRRVFLAYRTLFSGPNAAIRQIKSIRKIVTDHAASYEQIIRDFGIEKTGDIIRSLLKDCIFESEIKAKLAFPELFQITPLRNAQRQALESEAASSEAEALEDLVLRDVVPEQNIEHVKEEVEKSEGPISTGLIITSLYPASVPYNIQHLILTTTQQVLEECCFDFATKWVPKLLEDKSWDCPEACELTLWTRTLFKLSGKLPADAFFINPDHSLEEIFSSIDPLRHSAVHRLTTSARGIQKLMGSAIQLATTLGDSTRAATLELVERELDSHIKDMQLNKNFLENRLDQQLKAISEQHAELDRKEVEVVAVMVREDLENKKLVGSIMKTAVEEAFKMEKETKEVVGHDCLSKEPDRLVENAVEQPGESCSDDDLGEDIGILL